MDADTHTFLTDGVWFTGAMEEKTPLMHDVSWLELGIGLVSAHHVQSLLSCLSSNQHLIPTY